MNQRVLIKKMRDSAVIPHYATEGSAAVDLVACLEEAITLAPGERRLIPTGIAISIPKNTVAILCARSGLSAKKGIAAANGIGVIDSDYRGEIFFSAVNLSQEAYTVTPGERVAQLMLMPVYTMALIETESLDETARGAGGFGSTGSL
ncbi:MAG: dUTP diphosphatase [Clostridia bacterium]|nr:dUTP diphosphatase [Clostridia bacterium]